MDTQEAGVAEFTRSGLEAAGFSGFVDIARLRASGCSLVPKEPGVYALLRNTTEPPTFLQSSIGGHYDGRNPTVQVDELKQNWIEGARVVYIGKAGTFGKKTPTLRRRLSLYMRFGAGKACAHWGGRYIWQLAECDDLLVAWKPLSLNHDPLAVERHLIGQFVMLYGKMPFANLL
ncbi:MAG: hypothetical protein Q7T82_02870 [Armatimonadota bacterium]|nr:hypothetical protein [Armatimonadota bacterium]